MFYTRRRGIVNRDSVFLIVVISVSLLLLFLPTGFEGQFDHNVQRPRGQVLEVDNSLLKQFGLVREGVQTLRVRLLDGPYAGAEVSATNNVVGKMEIDKIFSVGDTAIMVLRLDGDRLVTATAYDQYRLDAQLLLLAVFAFLLIGFAGWTGIRALVSFAFTALLLWKVLLPAVLREWDPIWTSLLVVAVLCGTTLFLVGGLTRKALVAFLGSILGIGVTCALALLFFGPLHVHGAVQPFAETLLYSGYPQLDLSRIFLAGIFVSASGALMDLAMDISAAVNEVVRKKPDISRWEAIWSGLAVGRAVSGTMVTTLLLAYAGGYMAMLMLFMGQGIAPLDMVNINYVAAEILKTIVGSFGLVTVAPFTAVVAGVLYAAK
ncbi:MAG TPA: YibE/F family protein [Chloroflexota bacterium]